MPQCTAQSKRSGERCRRSASIGYKVCHMHGANPRSKGGAPKGSKNALKHGEHETIFYDSLTDDERTLWPSISLDVAKQLDQELQLITIRERRMMQRIANLAGVEFTVVQRIHEYGQKEKGDVDFYHDVSEGALGQILKIEEALTRVQSQKSRIIDLKYRLTQSDDNHEIDKLVAAIDASRGRIQEQGDGA